jgi:hypothetical protein
MIRALAPLWRHLRLFYYRAALKQLQEQNAAHPDVAYLVLRVRELQR